VAALAVSGSRCANAYGACSTPGSNGPKPLWYLAFDAVRLTAPYVRPWNAPWNAITYGRPVAYRDSLSAPSTPSAPELVRNTRVGPEIGATSASAAHIRE